MRHVPPSRSFAGLFLCMVAVSGDGSLPSTFRGPSDESAMIQYNVHVATGDEPSSTMLEQDRQFSPEEQHAAAALESAHEVAAAATAEFKRLDIALRALSTRSSCADQATETITKISSLLEEVARHRAEVEGIVEKSAECRALPAGDVALLSIKSNSFPSDEDSVEVPGDAEDYDLSTVPGQFHRWHMGHFAESFRGQWHSVASLDQNAQGTAFADLHQRRHCHDEDVAPVAERGPGAATYQLFARRGVENGLDITGDPDFGSTMDSSGSDSIPGSITGGGISSMGNGTSSHSKWDSIMKNGFKQMAKMMNGKTEEHKTKCWYLLIVFLFLAVLIIVAILLVSRPLIATDEDTSATATRSGFVQVALIYWLPTTPESTGATFCALFASILVTSLCLNFWVGCFFLMLLKKTDAKIASQVEKAKIFNSEVLQILCAFGTAIGPVVFFVFRKQIHGRWRQWRYLMLKTYLLFEGQILGIIGGYMGRMQMNNIAAMDADAFWHVTRTIQMVMLVVGVVDTFCAGYIDNVLSLDWRRFLTEHFLSRYMGGHSYYKMNSNSGKDDGADNPDQRMQGDVESFAKSLDSFVFSIIKTVVTLISSTIIVWSVIPRVTMVLLGYCTIGSLVSLYFTWRFVNINYTIQKLEADYRYSMVHIRDNAEGIAFYGGENEGQGEVNERFHELLHWRYQLILLDISFGAYQFFYTTVGEIVPLILLSQMLFQGRIDFGAVGQVGGNFTNVMSSLSFINRSSHLMASLGTSTSRLTGMLRKIEALQGGEEITFVTSTDIKFKVADLSVKTPDERSLVRNLNIDYSGKGPAHLLVVGRSGVGKSSLMRTLAGLWSQGSGEVTMPPKGDCMFLPQKPYMPLGSLRKQLCYPAVGHAANDCDLRSMLEELGLGDLPDRFEEGFDATRDWSRVLSLGEQQRVAAIRAMIHQPLMVVLDESTSALSVLDENLIYKRFADLGISFISVGHRMTIVKFHDQVLELLQENGGWKLHSRAEYEKSLENQKQSS